MRFEDQQAIQQLITDLLVSQDESRNVIQSIARLSGNYENAARIVQGGIVPALMQIIDNPSHPSAAAAAEALRVIVLSVQSISLPNATQAVGLHTFNGRQALSSAFSSSTGLGPLVRLATRGPGSPGAASAAVALATFAIRPVHGYLDDGPSIDRERLGRQQEDALYAAMGALLEADTGGKKGAVTL